MLWFARALRSPGSRDLELHQPVTKAQSLALIPSSSAGDPWARLGCADLPNTVRRICVLCGWSHATAGSGQVLAITSAVQGEGKSSLAWAMAFTMAQDHAADVLLMECDPLSATLSTDVNIAPSPGLGEILAGEVEFAAALRPTTLPNLLLLPVGDLKQNPSRLLRSPMMDMVIAEARNRFSFILLDLPAVLRNSDAAVVARMADSAVLVVRSGSTPEQSVRQALHYLPDVPLQGVVLNRWRSAVPRLVRQFIES